MEGPLEEMLAEVVAQKKLVKDEMLRADAELAELMEDRSGLLEVTVRESRNVVASDDNSAYERPVKYLLSIKPATVVVEEGAFTEFEFTELPGKATFQVSSLEAKVVVHFGRSLEHHVSVVLSQSIRESELERLSDWHASTAGEETETPQIQDVSDVPAVRLGFTYKRANKEEYTLCTDRSKQLQTQFSELSKKEMSLKQQQQKQIVPSAPSSTALTMKDDDLDDFEDDNKPKGGILSRFGQWMVFPIIVVHKWGTTMMHVLWSRRAIVMFFGGAIFFHYRGDDCAV